MKNPIETTDERRESLIAKLVGYSKRFGPWHLDDNVKDVMWSGDNRPSAIEMNEMEATVDEAHKLFYLKFPKVPGASDWGLWKAIAGTGFYPEDDREKIPENTTRPAVVAPEIERVLVLSTCHITSKVNELLHENLMRFGKLVEVGLCYDNVEYGYLIRSVNYDTATRRKMPRCLVAICDRAKSLGCGMVLLDCDGQEDATLRKYNW